MIILGFYTLLEGVRGNLNIEFSLNKENPEDVRGVSVQWIVAMLMLLILVRIKEKVHCFKCQHSHICVYTPLLVFKCACHSLVIF